jgi:hypothetical protein
LKCEVLCALSDAIAALDEEHDRAKYRQVLA